VSISEAEDFLATLDEFRFKLDENRSFFKNSPLSLDLGWRELEPEELEALLEMVRQEEINLQGIISASQATRSLAEHSGLKVIIGRLGLSEHRGKTPGRGKKHEPAKPARTEADTLLVKRTLRSGQQVDFPGNVVVVGDVNPGAEIRAGGDIVVMGVMRGVAFAGSSGNRNAQVIAYQLKPSQLRIGDLIGTPDDVKPPKPGLPIVARVKDEDIVTAVFGTRD
jgi:septum site-determining protein MinC